MFEANLAIAVKLEERRRLIAVRWARCVASVWRRNCIVSSFAAHTREKRARQKQPAKNVAWRWHQQLTNNSARLKSRNHGPAKY
jgi:hypothetical protein